jgi:hypothetical protein
LNDIRSLFEPIKRLHAKIRQTVVSACENASFDELSEVIADGEGDTIFAIDRISEETLIEFFETEIAPRRTDRSHRGRHRSRQGRAPDDCK